MREELLTAVRTRLLRVEDHEDFDAVLTPEAQREARHLARLVDEPGADLDMRSLLGWLHWYRYAALPEGADTEQLDQELSAAANAFAPCFVVGDDDLPEPLLPVVACTVAPEALEMLERGRTSGPELLSTVVALWRRINEAADMDDPERGLYRAALGDALHNRYEETGAPEDLEQAVEQYRSSVRITPVDDPDRAARLSALAVSLHDRHEETGAPEDLDAAIEHLRAAVRLTRPDDPIRASRLWALTAALQARYFRAWTATDLDAAVEHGQTALRAGSEHLDRCHVLSKVGILLSLRFDKTETPEDLDTAIAYLGEALQTAATDDPARASYLGEFGDMLFTRWLQSGFAQDLDDAVNRLHDAVQAAADAAERALYLPVLTDALHARYESTGRAEDLENAIAHGEEAARLEKDADLQRKLSGLRDTRRERALAPVKARLLRISNLNDPAPAAEPSALHEARQLTELLEEDDRDLELRFTLGWLHWYRVQALPEEEKEQALEAAVQALERCFAGGVDGLPTPLAPLLAHAVAPDGVRLLQRVLESSDPDLADAVPLIWQRITRAVAPDDPDRPAFLSNLCAALHLRAERTGTSNDLDKAVEAGRDAVRAAYVDDPGRPAFLSNLAVALRARYEREGTAADLDDAVNRLRDALATMRADHADRPACLSNLGMTLRTRFERTAAMTDLDAAVDHLREAMRSTPEGNPDRPGRLSNLANALATRFDRAGLPEDLDEAVEAGRDAVRTTSTDHPGRPVYLSNLGSALRNRAERTGLTADLDEAVGHHREALRHTPVDHPDHSLNLFGLGSALRNRAERTGSPADLDEAVGHHREALRHTPVDHLDRVRLLQGLANTLLDRYDRTAESADLEAAIAARTEASHAEAAPPRVRASVALATAALLTPVDAGRAAEMAETAVRLMPLIASRQLEREDQQHLLGELVGQAGNAAALALEDSRGTGEERAIRALRLLETGRATLLSQALDTRGDLTELRNRHPRLAARYTELRDQLDPSPNISPAAERNKDAVPGSPPPARDRHRLASEFTETLAEVRALDGFASFARPPDVEELLAEAAQGPVVVCNVSPYRCDALLLTGTGISHLELPRLTATELVKKAASFHQALPATYSRDRAERKSAQGTLRGVLEWLWDTIAGPVLDALGLRSQPDSAKDWPRVWWAPGGLLGLLPLHAAGHHTDPTGPGRRSVMDRAISSYTPTVRALRHARERDRDRTHGDSGQADTAQAPARPLIVAMPTTPGLPHGGRLRFVPEEVTAFRNHLPEPVVLQPGPSTAHAPTKANVLAHLPNVSIAHFACHGHSDPEDPSHSELLLLDHENDPLSVAALASLRLDRAELAYLSACRTAVVDVSTLADEAIHMTSAFQVAGFPHVIGTLWTIDDETAVTIADTFYAHLRTNGGTLDTGRAAHALHTAVRAARDAAPRLPSLWAAHLHAGA